MRNPIDKFDRSLKGHHMQQNNNIECSLFFNRMQCVENAKAFFCKNTMYVYIYMVTNTFFIGKIA